MSECIVLEARGEEVTWRELGGGDGGAIPVGRKGTALKVLTLFVMPVSRHETMLEYTCWQAGRSFTL